MLGNDIVDLQKAALESNWKRKGYLEKVFTANEQIAIRNSSNPNTMVWLLWTMKEAVYKIVNRQTLERFYSPQKFECNFTHEEYGSVSFNMQLYFTKSTITDTTVHTIASTSTTELNKINLYLLTYEADYLKNFNSTFAEVVLTKNDIGLPYVFNKNDNTKYDASITHHGKYLAVVYPVDGLN